MTLRLIIKIKKGFENTLFGIRRGGKHPPLRTIIYIYIYIYIYKGKKEHPKGITIHTVSSQFFLFETKKSFLRKGFSTEPILLVVVNEHGVLPAVIVVLDLLHLNNTLVVVGKKRSNRRRLGSGTGGRGERRTSAVIINVLPLPAFENTLFRSGNGRVHGVLATHSRVVERFGFGLVTNRTAHRVEKRGRSPVENPLESLELL